MRTFSLALMLVDRNYFNAVSMNQVKAEGCAGVFFNGARYLMEELSVSFRMTGSDDSAA